MTVTVTVYMCVVVGSFKKIGVSHQYETHENSRDDYVSFHFISNQRVILLKSMDVCGEL